MPSSHDDGGGLYTEPQYAGDTTGGYMDVRSPLCALPAALRLTWRWSSRFRLAKQRAATWTFLWKVVRFPPNQPTDYVACDCDAHS